MSQEGYFSCMGCGRVFKLNDVEFAEYGLHNCDEPDDRLIVPGRSSLVDRLLDRLLWKQ